MLAASAAICAFAYATEPCDTVVDVSNADVIVSQTDEGLTINVVSNNENDNKTYFYQYNEGETYIVDRTYNSPATLMSRHNFSLAFSGFSIGFNKALDAPSGMGQEMGKSLEISIDQLLSFQWRLPNKRNMFAIGVGLDWRNYRLNNDKRFVRKDSEVTLEGYAEGENPGDSRLKTFSIQIPISYTYSVNSYVKFGLAAILNANTYGSLKSHYTTTDGTKQERFQKCSSDIRKFTVDFKATVQFCPFVALYCKYSPMDVFKSGRGPEFTPLSTGFTFFY